MDNRQLHGVLCAALLTACVPVCAAGAMVISEFMAINDTGIRDEDGTRADWIELYNSGPDSVNLENWYLTDKASNLRKWEFPATNCPPGGCLLVFASEKNRRQAGAELHTNFKLSGDGEFLALVMPNGTTIAHGYVPAFPAQVPDVSYGLAGSAESLILVTSGAPCSAYVPVHDALGCAWTSNQPMAQTGWLMGTTGVGYEHATGYESLIGLDVGTPMYGINGSCYVRIPFVVSDPARVGALTLRMKYDDGFAAYLNGTEVMRVNAPVPLLWNSRATALHNDSDAVIFEGYAITQPVTLVAGTNMLAIHGLNEQTTSSDFLILPELHAALAGTLQTNDIRYFIIPTPGAPNNAGVTNFGAIFRGAGHRPLLPGAADALIVTARISDVKYGVSSAALRYRVMFGPELALPMRDDGTHGDGAAGDGIYGAIIPAGVAAPGEMVRYYLVATNGAGMASRWPLPHAPEQYLGTVIHDSALQTNVPVYHMFVPYSATNAIDTDVGTLCTFFYNGEFYDNVLVQQRGGWTSTNPLYQKRSHQYKFPHGHAFRYQPGVPRADNVNINAMYNDQSYARELLCWDSYRAAGAPGCTAFHVELRLNGAFHSLGLFVEQPDDDFLERNGYDQRGALYKAVNNQTYLITTDGVVKKRPLDGDSSDLHALVAGLNNGTTTDKERYAFDHIDLPALVSYMTVDLAVQDVDSKHKNYYLYRDTYGDGEWRMFGWDKDLSMGHVWDSASTSLVWNINWYSDNRMHRLLFDVPVFAQMFARRSRTVMDMILQAPDAPANERFYERRISQLHSALKPLADADRAKYGWPTNITGYFHYPHLSFDGGIHELTNTYIQPRRGYIYNTYGWWLPQPQPSNVVLRFGALDIAPVSGNQNEEFIEITNINIYAVDISGWRLSNAVAFTFRPGTVIAAGRSLYVSPDVKSFRARTRSPKGGERRFVQGPYAGRLSSWGGTVTLLNERGETVAVTNFAASLTAQQRYLRISEIMYHPPAPSGGPYQDEDFEFIELVNTHTEAISVGNSAFSAGIYATLSGTLPPGECLVLVRNLSAFATRYSTNGIRIGGVYSGGLDNSGENLQLNDYRNEIIHAFRYSDTWYPSTDGGGYSLESADVYGPLEAWNSASGWRASTQWGGTPGYLIPEPAALLAVLAACGLWCKRVR